MKEGKRKENKRKNRENRNQSQSKKRHSERKPRIYYTLTLNSSQVVHKVYLKKRPFRKCEHGWYHDNDNIDTGSSFPEKKKRRRGMGGRQSGATDLG